MYKSGEEQIVKAAEPLQLMVSKEMPFQLVVPKQKP
jgi:hypothetical protein